MLLGPLKTIFLHVSIAEGHEPSCSATFETHIHIYSHNLPIITPNSPLHGVDLQDSWVHVSLNHPLPSLGRLRGVHVHI